jgi:CRP-like cAMP-binding protein
MSGMSATPPIDPSHGLPTRITNDEGSLSLEADLADLVADALPGATPETRAALVRTARVRSVDPEGLIWRQGETTQLTQIIRGYGAFRRTTVDGGQHIVGLCQRGALFGFSSIASVETPVDLVALTKVDAVLWPGRDIRPLAASDPGFALNVIDTMARFLLQTNERMDGILYQDTRRRVLRVLASYGDLFFGQPSVLSRAHLPSLVGTTREMTGRVIRELEREGLVARVGRRGLVVLSAEGLQRALPRSAASRD